MPTSLSCVMAKNKKAGKYNLPLTTVDMNVSCTKQRKKKNICDVDTFVQQNYVV